MIMSRTIIFSQVFFHAVFEQIHPFVDGNGRVGRTLMNDYFMIHDIAPTMIYHEDKHEHYKSLEAIDVNEDLDPLISFIEKEQEKTWSRTQKKKDREARFVSILAWLLKTHICLKCEFFYGKIGVFSKSDA